MCKTNQIHVRLTSSVYSDVKSSASAMGVSVHKYLEYLIAHRHLIGELEIFLKKINSGKLLVEEKNERKQNTNTYRGNKYKVCSADYGA